MGALKRAIADTIDQPRHAARRLINRIKRWPRELHAALTSGSDGQAMLHVSGHAFRIEWPELASDRDALVHLPHLRQFEIRTKLGLTNENDLKQLVPPFQFREYANFFEQRQR